MSDVPSAARPCCRTDTWHDCKKTKQNLFCFSFSQCPLVVGVETLWWRFCQWHVCNGTLQQKNKKLVKSPRSVVMRSLPPALLFPLPLKKYSAKAAFKWTGEAVVMCVCVYDDFTMRTKSVCVSEKKPWLVLWCVRTVVRPSYFCVAAVTRRTSTRLFPKWLFRSLALDLWSVVSLVCNKKNKRVHSN